MMSINIQKIFKENENVLLANNIVDAWNKVIKENRSGRNYWLMNLSQEIEIRYSPNLLQRFLKQKEWFLVFDPGFSLKDMFLILGMNREKELYFHSDFWRFPEKKHSWMNKRVSPEYYLIRMAPLYSNKNWQQQEEKIGKKFKRPSTRLFLSLAISRFLLTGECPQKGCHWGPEKEGFSRSVSYIAQNKIFLFNWSEEWGTKDIGVNLICDFDL